MVVRCDAYFVESQIEYGLHKTRLFAEKKGKLHRNLQRNA